MVKTKVNNRSTRTRDARACGSGFLCAKGLKALLLILGGFRAVLVEKFHGLGRLVLVESDIELVDGGWGLEALLEHLALTLDANVAGPPHKATEVTFGQDRASNAEGARSLLEHRLERVLALLPAGLLRFRFAGHDVCLSRLSGFFFSQQGTLRVSRVSQRKKKGGKCEE